MRTSGNDLEIRLAEAIKNPHGIDMTDLGSAILGLLPQPSYFYAQTPNGFQFTVRNVGFRVTFPGGRLILQCRHLEAIAWLNGKFDNRKRNKVKELLARISATVNRPPSPFDS